MSNDNKNTNEQQVRATVQSLTESFLKAKTKEDPTVTEDQKEEFRKIMGELAEHMVRQPRS